MYQAQFQQADEHKGAPLQAHDGGQNANPLKQLLDTLLIMGDGNSDEWTLLQSIAWLDSRFIPEELLLAVTGNDQSKLWKTIATLERLSLVKTTSKGESKGITLPWEEQEQIVDYVSNNHAESKDATKLLLDLVEVLSSLLPEVTDQHNENWEKAAIYAQAVEALLAHSARRNLPIPESKELALLNAKLGEFYWNVSIDAVKSLDYKARALAIYQTIYQDNHQAIAISLNNLGKTYATLGCINKALPYLEQAFTMKRSLYRGPHADVANALNNLGGAYVTLGESWKGIAYLQQALMMNKALYKENHHTVASSLNNVGSAYASIGETWQGLEYQKQALAMYESLYEAPQHDIALSLYNVGTAHEKLGDDQQSLIYKERALEMRQALYEGDHPDLARSLHAVGDAYKALGDAKKALGYYENALAMRHSIYGDKALDVASSLNAIGVAHEALGDAKSCLDYQTRALQIWQSLSPGNHPGIATSLNNLAVAYRKLGDAQKSLYYSERALVMRQALYPGNHPDVVASLNAMSVAYWKLSDNEKALNCCEQALNMRQALYPGNHPEVAASLNDMGAAYQNLGDTKKAFDYYELALAMRQSLHHGNDPDVVASLMTMGLAYQELKDYKKARHYLGRAYQMKQALEKKEEFKGQGLLNYVSDSRLEYYNGGIDRILGLRLGGIGYDGKAAVLKSRYFGESSTAARLADDAGAILSGGTAKTVFVPVNLYNKHWLGLLFKRIGTTLEVTYMDSEQRTMVPQLKEVLEQRLTINGYQSSFTTPRLEQQRYGNCGPEVIENYVYHLTGTRAMQEAAVYVHSLLVENSLLDFEEYGLKLEENTRLIGFLSNTAPLPIRSISATFLSSSNLIRGSLKDSGADGQAALNLLPAIEQFNRLSAKWVQDKLQQVNAGIYKTTLWFKGLDLTIDSARLVYDPELDNAKKVALDTAQLYGMYSGVNGYSVLVSGAEVVYQLHLGEYQKASDVAAGAIASMALPIILAHANRPYLVFVYSVWVAASTAYNALDNAYSFALEILDGLGTPEVGSDRGNDKAMFVELEL